MMLRPPKAMRDLHQGPMPTVTVGQAQQVNAASQQVDVVEKG